MNALFAIIDIPDSVAGHLPKNFITFLNFVWVFWFLVTRACKNLKAGGGWYGIKQGLLFGDKSTAAEAADAKQAAAHSKPQTPLAPEASDKPKP